VRKHGICLSPDHFDLSEGFSSTSLPEQFRVMLKNRNARRRRWDKLDGVFAGALPESV
jgi:hypothetical protein